MTDANELTLRSLQEQMIPWVKHNFGDRPSWQPLLGIGEEVGELMHAHLKDAQGIRGTAAEHRAAKVDAVADILIYLADYCTAENIDLQDALTTTWNSVRARDWKADPRAGGTGQ